ncbi:MAG TPA: hypothetical protein PLF56_09270 [Micropruina sp.]|nr:hypothetical protein [Micropruina sp.]
MPSRGRPGPDPATPLTGRSPASEIVVPDLESSVRWHQHDFPHPLARWHTHPEVEVHLIRRSTGLAFVGDYIGPFGPGHFVLVGSQLPHNWLSDLEPDEMVAGRDVVILGRGFTLGRPLSMLLSLKRPGGNAAVTVVHTGVPNWADYTRRADIVIAAAGVPGILRPEHITAGRVVVGGGVRYEGRRLLPDVDEACNEVAGWITPRVGGVGPTTIAMLFRNCVEAAEGRAAR